jgi:hypothetical protein
MCRISTIAALKGLRCPHPARGQHLHRVQTDPAGSSVDQHDLARSRVDMIDGVSVEAAGDYKHHGGR